jgi:hypothetical protein
MNKNTLKIVSAGGLALCIIITIGHACQDETTLDYFRMVVGLIAGTTAFVVALAIVLGGVWVGNNLLTFIFEQAKKAAHEEQPLNQSKEGRTPSEHYKDKNND